MLELCAVMSSLVTRSILKVVRGSSKFDAKIGILASQMSSNVTETRDWCRIASLLPYDGASRHTQRGDGGALFLPTASGALQRRTGMRGGATSVLWREATLWLPQWRSHFGFYPVLAVCTACRPILHEVQFRSSLAASTGHKLDPQ